MSQDGDLRLEIVEEHSSAASSVDNERQLKGADSGFRMSPSTLDLDKLNQQLTEHLGQAGIASDVNSSLLGLFTRIHHLSLRWITYSNIYKLLYSLGIFAVIAINVAIAVVGYNNQNFVEATLNAVAGGVIACIATFKLSVNGAEYRKGSFALAKIRREIASELQETSRKGTVDDNDLMIKINGYQDQIDDLQLGVLSSSQFKMKTSED